MSNLQIRRYEESNKLSWNITARDQGRPYGGAREGHVPPLENVENIGKLFTVVRIYLFRKKLIKY